MSSCSLSYLGGVFDHAAMILCGSDAVTDPVTCWFITSQSVIRQVSTIPHTMLCRFCFCVLYIVLYAPTPTPMINTLHKLDSLSLKAFTIHIRYAKRRFLDHSVIGVEGLRPRARPSSSVDLMKVMTVQTNHS